MILLPFQEWCESRSAWGGLARAAFWYTQNFANLDRATFTHWTMRQRHWPEEPYLHECLADLRDQLRAKRRKTRRRK
jgi:hypothetical protein